MSWCTVILALCVCHFATAVTRFNVSVCDWNCELNRGVFLGPARETPPLTHPTLRRSEDEREREFFLPPLETMPPAPRIRRAMETPHLAVFPESPRHARRRLGTTARCTCRELQALADDSGCEYCDPVPRRYRPFMTQPAFQPLDIFNFTNSFQQPPVCNCNITEDTLEETIVVIPYDLYVAPTPIPFQVERSTVHLQSVIPGRRQQPNHRRQRRVTRVRGELQREREFLLPPRETIRRANRTRHAREAPRLAVFTESPRQGAPNDMFANNFRQPPVRTRNIIEDTREANTVGYQEGYDPFVAQSPNPIQVNRFEINTVHQQPHIPGRSEQRNTSRSQDRVRFRHYSAVPHRRRHLYHTQRISNSRFATRESNSRGTEGRLGARRSARDPIAQSSRNSSASELPQGLDGILPGSFITDPGQQMRFIQRPRNLLELPEDERNASQL